MSNARTLTDIETELSVSIGVETYQVLRQGDLLNEAKQLLEHGQWLPWLKRHWPTGESTAQKYMKAATWMTKSLHGRDLGGITVHALHELASQNPDEETLSLILDIAEKRTLSAYDIKDIVKRRAKAAIAAEVAAEEEAQAKADRDAKIAWATNFEPIGRAANAAYDKAIADGKGEDCALAIFNRYVDGAERGLTLEQIEGETLGMILSKDKAADEGEEEGEEAEEESDESEAGEELNPQKVYEAQIIADYDDAIAKLVKFRTAQPAEFWRRAKAKKSECVRVANFMTEIWLEIKVAPALQPTSQPQPLPDGGADTFEQRAKALGAKFHRAPGGDHWITRGKNGPIANTVVRGGPDKIEAWLAAEEAVANAPDPLA
jgi:hypothetical protein